LYDKFLELNKVYPQTTLIFKPNILPFDAYNEHTNLNLPPIGELWKDRDMMIAFRQYLYTKYSHENLSYYLYAEVFKLCPDDQLEQICNEIYENFFSPTAPTPLNIDFVLAKKLNEDRKRPHRKMFDAISLRIYRALENEWYPLFITSEIYKSLNEETLQLNRERSKTIDNYDYFIEYSKPKEESNEEKNKEEKNNDQKEDQEEENENNQNNNQESSEEGEKVKKPKKKKKKTKTNLRLRMKIH